MRVYNCLVWLYERIGTYNLFIPEDDISVDDDGQQVDTAKLIRQQKLATWIYVSLFIICFYNLFLLTLMTPQTLTITSKDITPIVFEQLHQAHHETLSCPCTSVNIPYNTFISSRVRVHPICNSDFVERSWIESFYLVNRSEFFSIDFRTTAFAQFALLADLCSTSEKVVSEALNDLDQRELVSIELQQNDTIQSQIGATVQLIQTMAPVQVLAILNLLQVMYRSNALVSALGTNANIFTILQYAHIGSTFYWTGHNYSISGNRFEQSCMDKNLVAPAGFYDERTNGTIYFRTFWPHNPYSEYERDAYVMLDGFFGGCFALDALLASTLDCLYSNACLITLSNYFPTLNRSGLQQIGVLPASNHRVNSTVKDLVASLFVERWSTEINYTDYFDQCASVQCTYSATDVTSLSYAITVFIGLYGGLTAILRILASSVVSLVDGVRRHLKKAPLASRRARINPLVAKIKRWNIFKSSARRTEHDIRQQLISTRCFIVLFSGSILVLILFNSLKIQTVTMVEHRPSSATYHLLQASYNGALRCPCSQAAMSYSNFVNLSAIFHQVCSSDLVSDAWIGILVQTRTSDFVTEAWLNEASRYFRYLSTLCELANKQVNDGIERFLARTMATVDLLGAAELQVQLNSTVNQLIETIIIGFRLFMEASNSLMQVDQPLNQLDKRQLIFNYNYTQSGIANRPPPEYIFLPNIIVDDDYNQGYCICTVDPSCQGTIPFMLYAFISISMITGQASYTDLENYTAPGLIQGCYMIDTLRLSTLECFYADTVCFGNLLRAVNISMSHFHMNLLQLNVRPLIHADALSLFPPKTPLSLIIDKMMIEQWNISINFDRYYHTCQPIYCTYPYTLRNENYLAIITSFISLVGGASSALRLIIPWLVKLIFRISESKRKKTRSTRRTWLRRLQDVRKIIITLSYGKLISLNIFPARNFPNHLHRCMVRRLGQWSTRLHFLLLAITLCFLAFYMVFRPELLSKTYATPSLDQYRRLADDHNGTLQCPCNLISVPYRDFVSVNADFHQICSSIFVLNEWRKNLTQNLNVRMNLYAITDYRRFLSAHLLFLDKLCQLSIRSVDYFIKQFLSSLLITDNLLSKSTFDRQIDSTLANGEITAHTVLTRLLFFLRSTSHANAMVSTYGTNYKYLNRWPHMSFSGLVAEAVTFNDNCSCGLNASCTFPATFVSKNSSARIPLDGLRMGCTPSESLLASTLQCFYDASCIHLILQMVNENYTQSGIDIPLPLQIDSRRFSIDTNVSDLADHLFVEQWSTVKNYSLYYERCSPIQCSYSYHQKLFSSYTVTYLLSLYGGLSIIFQWICPRVVYALVKLFQCYKKRSTAIKPSNRLEISVVSADRACATQSL